MGGGGRKLCLKNVFKFIKPKKVSSTSKKKIHNQMDSPPKKLLKTSWTLSGIFNLCASILSRFLLSKILKNTCLCFRVISSDEKDERESEKTSSLLITAYKERLKYSLTSSCFHFRQKFTGKHTSKTYD
jgi:hypothetical protein